jgi:hypothetical protein
MTNDELLTLCKQRRGEYPECIERDKIDTQIEKLEAKIERSNDKNSKSLRQM